MYHLNEEDVSSYCDKTYEVAADKRWYISSKTLRRFTSNAEAFWFKQLIVFGKELILSNRTDNRGQDMKL